MSMKQRTDIEKEVQESLESLDDMHRASPRPYFYIRLKARLDREKSKWGKVAGFISRPVFAMAMICAVLSVNAWILFKSDVSVSNNSQAIINTDVPEEYNLAVATFYDYETP